MNDPGCQGNHLGHSPAEEGGGRNRRGTWRVASIGTWLLLQQLSHGQPALAGPGLLPLVTINWYLGKLSRPLIQLPISTQVAIKHSGFGLKQDSTLLPGKSRPKKSA